MDIMLPAFFECLVLVGIHSYLGIHVIKRQVIFVDLALAQIAALGTTVAFLFGIMPKTTAAYWFSLGFTFIGAAVFSLSRFRKGKIPQEAVIGLVYALAAAISILVIDKAPHGAEHIKEILTGSILWVKWQTIGKAAIVYALVGAFHFIFRDKFLLISNNPEKAYESGISVKLWDFLFYLTFGIVITHSVGTAGVLMVFVFLVVPAITSMMITDKLWQQLLIGWSMGLIVSVIGLYVSYVADLPSGPTVVSFYGLVLLLVSVALYVIKSKQKSAALKKVGIGVAVVFLIGLAFYTGGKYTQKSGIGHQHVHALASDSIDSIKVTELAQLSEIKLSTLLQQVTDLNWLEQAFNKNDDAFVRLSIVERTLEIDKRDGGKLALKILRDQAPVFVREQVCILLKKYFGQDFGYQPDDDQASETNQKALQAWEHWLRK
ncbi:MAG: metal ABC transporter permease [Calditrichaeota bacterium]|nr:metal ABC transporter permease [Calditrichota bacterium]